MNSLALVESPSFGKADVYVNQYPITCWDFQHTSSDRYVGYRALWLKVIIRAAFDWVTYRDSTKLENFKEAEKAAKWLFEPSELTNSLDSVCRMVDLPPNKMRMWAKNLSKDQVAKIEHLERETSYSPVAFMSAQRKLLEDLDFDDEND
jgi:hypothetical protein